MRLDYLMVSLVVFSVIVIAGVSMVNDMNTSYNLSMDTSDFEDTYDTIDEMYNISQDTKDKTLDSDISDTDSWESMTKGSYSAIRMLSSTFELFGNILNEISIKLGIPSYFVMFALIVLTILIVMSIVYLIFHFMPS